MLNLKMVVCGWHTKSAEELLGINLEAFAGWVEHEGVTCRIMLEADKNDQNSGLIFYNLEQTEGVCR